MKSFIRQFQRTTDRIKKAKITALYRSTNRALSKTQTAWRRDISKETKLPAKKISPRLRMFKASSKKPTRGALSFATRWGVPLSEFKPRVKIVKKKRNKKTRKYKGVTAMLPSGRDIVPGAWIWEAKSGKSLVLQRKGPGRYPTKQPTEDLFPYADKVKGAAERLLRSEFQANYKKQFDYEISKLK